MKNRLDNSNSNRNKIYSNRSITISILANYFTESFAKLNFKEKNYH